MQTGPGGALLEHSGPRACEGAPAITYDRRYSSIVFRVASTCLTPSPSLSRRHALQRGRWAAERAYRPDPRALATLCSQRAEILRLEQGQRFLQATESAIERGSHSCCCLFSSWYSQAVVGEAVKSRDRDAVVHRLAPQAGPSRSVSAHRRCSEGRCALQYSEGKSSKPLT